MDKRFKGGYHLTKNDLVCIGIICKGWKLKFVTKLGFKEAYWEDGKEALKLPLDEANSIVTGLCLNGYRAFVADMYYYNEVLNPSETKEEE